ncbi:MAG TPA: hypothetical protein VFQ47_05060 [Nitrososphaera sp.]|nr:hypothetical protein [Nitrososphaera sp.]
MAKDEHEMNAIEASGRIELLDRAGCAERRNGVLPGKAERTCARSNISRLGSMVLEIRCVMMR